MNEIPAGDIITRLDERHEQLIAELDSLDQRLEFTLKDLLNRSEQAMAA